MQKKIGFQDLPKIIKFKILDQILGVTGDGYMHMQQDSQIMKILKD